MIFHFSFYCLCDRFSFHSISTSFDFVFDLLSSSTNPCLALLPIRDFPALFTPTSPLLIDISNFTDFVPLLLLTFFCSQTPLLNSQLAVSPSCHYICFLHLLPSALTTLIIDLISLLFTNPVSSSIDFLCYPDFKLLIVTVITAFFISSN